jgi:hypothetical protein
VDSVCIRLTSSNRVTFAENSIGFGSTCEPTCSGRTHPNPPHPPRSPSATSTAMHSADDRAQRPLPGRPSETDNGLNQ